MISLSTYSPRPEDIIRPALNIERHADVIFTPSHSKFLHKPRAKAWVKKQPDGSKTLASLTVEPYAKKRPTGSTRKVYLALNRLREARTPNVDGSTIASLREISNAMNKKWAGGRGAKAIYEELRRLRFAPITVKGAAFEILKDNEILEPEDTLTILSTLRFVKRMDRQRKQLFDAVCEFRFHNYIENYLQTNRTSPTLVTELEIAGEIAPIWYQRLDMNLSYLVPYERYRIRSEKMFFEELELESDVYRKYPKQRRRVMDERIIPCINKKPISTGILHCTTEPTVDGKDFNFVAWKEPFDTKRQVTNGYRPKIAPNLPDDIPFITAEIVKTLGKGVEYAKLYEKYAYTYPFRPTISLALSEYNADMGKTARHPVKVFNTILHRIVHLQGYEWFKACPENCKLRPQKKD